MSLGTGLRDVTSVSGLLVGGLVLGVALLVANTPWSPFRSSTLEIFVLYVLPVVIAVLAYVRFATPVVWWEVGALAIWGAISRFGAAFVGFFATMDTGGTGYPGPWIELLQNVLHFFVTTVGLGVPYALAGEFRNDHPWGSAAIVCLGAVVVAVLVITAAVVLSLPA
jgi:hypothetical protein